MFQAKLLNESTNFSISLQNFTPTENTGWRTILILRLVLRGCLDNKSQSQRRTGTLHFKVQVEISASG